MSIVRVERVPRIGLRHLAVAANGMVTNGDSAANIARLVNVITARRGKVLWSQQGALNALTPLGGSAGSAVFQGRFRTSKYAQDVEALTLYTAIDGTTTGQNFMRWTVGGVPQPRIQFGGKVGTRSPDEVLVHRQRLVDGGGASLAGDTVYSMSFTKTSAAVWYGAIFYETWRSQLDTAAGGLDPVLYGPGQPVLGSHLTDIIGRLWEIQRMQGSQQIMWSDTTGAPNTATGTTWRNVVDDSTAGYAATARGFWTYPHRKGTLGRNLVDVVFWCKAQSSAGTTGQVRFVNSAGTLATITGIGGDAYYEVAGTLDATLASDYVIIEQNNTDAARTTTTYAAGCYEYIP